MYVVGVPLGVEFRLKEPQEPTGAHVQLTPELAGSLATVAVTGAEPEVGRVVGGAGDIETVMVELKLTEA
jgi:hypothetical protein